MQTIPRAVLFDLDDTLYDFVTTSKKALDEVSRRIEGELGVPEAEAKADYVRILHMQEKENPTAGCHSRCIRFQIFLEERKLPKRLAPEYAEIYWNTLLDAMEPFAGVGEALEGLRERGLVVGIGTNMTAEWQLRKLDRLGLLEKVDFMLSSEEAGAEKPSKAFFEKAARKAGVAASECLFIGDNPVADIAGARAAGMEALWFQRDAQKAAQRPELESFSDYRTLVGLVMGRGKEWKR